MTKKNLVKRAIDTREAARAVKDFTRSNRINFLLYLVNHAGDTSETSQAKLEEAIK